MSKIDDPHKWELDYEQLFAQLRDEYVSGFPYWFKKEEEKRMKAQNDCFRIISDEEMLISQRFRKPKTGEKSLHLSAANIAQMISYGRMTISSRRVSLTMKKLGFKSERNSEGCYYLLFDMDHHEQQAVITEKLSQQLSDYQTDAEEQPLPF